MVDLVLLLLGAVNAVWHPFLAGLQEPMLGEFPFCSGKAARLIEENKGRCRAFMYVMHVSEELASWPERHKRTRLWVRAQQDVWLLCHMCCMFAQRMYEQVR